MFAKHSTRLFAIASGCWLHLAISTVAVATEPVLSNAELSVIQTHGPWPAPVPPDPGNEYSGLRWAEKVGEKLFFQTGLSANGSVACSTCHVPDKGFSDARPLALGIDQGFRNTQGLFDMACNDGSAGMVALTVYGPRPVSYTHLTLPTIYSV